MVEFHILLVLATTVFCAEQTVSASLICPVVDGLLKHHLKIKDELKMNWVQEFLSRGLSAKNSVVAWRLMRTVWLYCNSTQPASLLRSSHRLRVFFVRKCNR